MPGGRKSSSSMPAVTSCTPSEDRKSTGFSSVQSLLVAKSMFDRSSSMPSPSLSRPS